MKLKRLLPIAFVVGCVGKVAVAIATRPRKGRAVRSSRSQRNADLLKLGANVGVAYAGTAARKLFASTERRIELNHDRELRTAAAVADRLGQMKGALMKLGQMASYVDEALPAPLREALAQLQSNAPPMADISSSARPASSLAASTLPRASSSNAMRA